MLPDYDISVAFNNGKTKILLVKKDGSRQRLIEVDGWCTVDMILRLINKELGRVVIESRTPITGN